jgi:CheY-like chemotaxis protein
MVAAFAPRQLIEQQDAMMRGMRKDVDLLVEVDERVPEALLGDENKLKHVLMNLTSNAVAATAEGSVTVAVLLERAPSEAVPTCAVRFEVRDTGKGIAPEQRRRLFEKYYSSGKRNGTGLGLYLSDQFVRLMGSRVEVESPWAADGSSGSRFSFLLELPVADPADVPRSTSPLLVPVKLLHADGASDAGEDAGGEAARCVAGSGTRPSDPLVGRADYDRKEQRDEEADLKQLSNWRVLLVDDLSTNRRILQRILTRSGPFAGAGWSMTHASTGEEALAEVARAEAAGEGFHLVVCDQNMSSAGGEILGSEVVARLRGMRLAVRPVLVISSGNCSDSDSTAYARAGADLVWAKPLPPAQRMWNELESSLRRHLRRCRRRREAGEAANAVLTTGSSEAAIAMQHAPDPELELCVMEV